MRKMTLSASALVLGLAAGSASAGNNELVVDQIGNGNFGDSSQVGTDNETLLQQLGNVNTGSLAITGSGVAREDIFVRQETGGNFAQYGGDGVNNLRDNDFGVIQGGGAYNTAAFSQTAGNNDNQIGVIQDGTQNVVGGGASGNASRGWGGATVNNSQLSITMTDQSTNGSALLAATAADAPIAGDNNFVGVAQLGARNIMGVKVEGNNNTIAGGPLGGSYATAINFNVDSGTSVFSPNAMIDGESHTDGLFPGGGVQGYLDSQSNGLAVQAGSDNQAALTQVGDNNIIAFGQISNDNRAQITQVGNGNYQQAVQN